MALKLIPMNSNKAVSDWTVAFTRKAAKQFEKLPTALKDSVTALREAIIFKGPVRGDWPNYSKLGDG